MADSSKTTVVIGSDHAGYLVKQRLVRWLTLRGYTVEDAGTHSEESCDYPEYAKAVAKRVLKDTGKAGKDTRGILICGTGLGMCYTANRFKGIRAALCWNIVSAELSRLHNNSNVLVLPGKAAAMDPLEDILLAWLKVDFSGEGRHQRRIDLID